MYSGEVRPKTGAPCMFPKVVEEDMALFMKHCEFLRIPRTRQMLRKDIVHYVYFKEMTVPKMPKDGPGNCNNFSWFQSSFTYLLSGAFHRCLHMKDVRLEGIAHKGLSTIFVNKLLR